MDHVLSYLLRFDGSQARSELKATKGTHDQLKSSAQSAGTSHRKLAGDLGSAGAAAGSAAARVDSLSAAEQRVARDALNVAKGHTLAAGSVGNLTAQFNDIGMMMMAGQNPLQLAVQQGTQITQVIGPMGAAGAVRALGSAFVQMVNPVSLITIGSIAAGAAIMQWLTSSESGAKSAADAFDALSTSTKEYGDLVRQLNADTADLEARFGSGADAARGVLEQIEEIKRRAAAGDIRVAIDVMLDESDLDLPSYDFGDQSRLAGDFDLGWLIGRGREAKYALINPVLEGYAELSAVANGSIDEQIAAFDVLAGAYERAARAAGGVTEEENARLQQLADMRVRLLELKALDEARAGRDQADADELTKINERLSFEADLTRTIVQYGAESAEVADLRLEREREIYQAKLDQMRISDQDRAASLSLWDQANPRSTGADIEAERQAAAAEKLAQIRERDQANAERMLLTMQQENRVQAAIIAHGEKSAQVTALRTQIEGENLDLILEQSKASDDVKEAIRSAWQEGQVLNATDMSAGISAARAEAQAMTDEIVRAVAAVQSLQQQAAQSVADADIRLKHAGDPVATARALGAERMKRQQASLRDGASIGELAYLDQQAREYGDKMAHVAEADQARLEALRAQTSRRAGGRGGRRGGGGSSRASALKQEREAVQNLIQSLTDQVAILRETDPIQKEMLRNREALKGATDAERKAVQELIETHVQEEQQIAALTERNEALRSLGNDALSGLILRGESLNDVLANLAISLAEMALQAALLGSGPLSGLFGGAGGGGLLSWLFPAPVAKAEGGMIYGPGSGTSDSVPALLSSGEFVINAAATREHRALLEAINGGSEVLRFSRGGVVSAAAWPVREFGARVPPSPPANSDAAPASKSEILVKIAPSPLLRAEIAETAQNVSVQVVQEYDRDVAPTTLQRVSGDQRRRG